MAFRKGNYWYRSHRKGGRVLTEYLGKEDRVPPELIAGAMEAARRKAARIQLKPVIEAQREVDQKLDAVTSHVCTLVKAALLVAGFHDHHGEWRPRR